MKRLFTLLAAALMTAAVASAQDVETFNAAVETFNSGALARGDGNNVEALSMFKQALTMFEGCGEEGAEMVEWTPHAAHDGDLARRGPHVDARQGP